MRYPTRTIFSRTAAQGLRTALAVCVIAMLSSGVGRAQSMVTLTVQTADLSIVSSDSPSQLPAIVSADAAPLQGQILLANESHFGHGAAPANNDSVGKFSIVVTSMFDHRVIDRCELTSSPDASPASTPESPAAQQRWEFQLKQRLPSGVYELKLEPTVSVSSRFRELLPWERSSSKDRGGEVAHTLSTQTWPLIVLPKTKPTTAVAPVAADIATSATANDSAMTRQLLVHWAGFADMVADAESLTSSSHSSSPLAWILTSPNHVQMTPPQRWAEIMQRIDERLDAIHAAGADGIVVDQAVVGSMIDATDPHMILMQCLHAKATQLDMGVWQQESVAEIAELNPAESDTRRLTLTRLESWPPAASSSRSLRAAAFLRPPAQTIRGQFPAEMDAAADADLLWFGFQSAADVTSHSTLSSPDSDAELAAIDRTYPLAGRNHMWLAEAWLADWSSWCINHTSLQLEKGLIVDETLLHPEITLGSASVSDVTMLWDTCWSETSRWLADSAVADASKPGGAAAKSLAQVRHANAGDGTVLVCLNQAPWPMRVRFPLANLVRWADVGPAQVGAVHLTKPAVTELGSTIVIPASSMVVCYAEQRISHAMHFSVETDDARKRVAELTRQVTTIVENLGILGELAGMTSRASSTDPRLADDRRARTNPAIVRQASTVRPAVPSSASERANGVSPATSESSFWSTERWGLSRAVTSSNDATSSVASASGSSLQMMHPVSTTTAADASQSGDGKPFDASPSSEAANSKCRNLLVNGGFELPHEIGVPGWMQAHHPNGAVEIDKMIRSEGRQSVRLQGKTTTGASAWLISREIARPIAGRLGISMSLRGEAPRLPDASGTPVEPTAAAEPIEIRVAIEGERNGQPIRHSETVRVAPNGKWHVGRFVLQWLDVDPRQDHNLHITIDNLSTSTVWIDDIVVTDYFASAQERSDLQSLAYLAVQGLQHSDLRPAAKLMKNFWAQDLLRIARFQSMSQEREPGSGVLTRDVPSFEKTRGELGLPSPAWGAGTVQANPVPANTVQTNPTQLNDAEPFRESSENALTTAQLPRLPASTILQSEPTGGPALETNETDSAASLGGKIRRWLPPPLKF